MISVIKYNVDAATFNNNTVAGFGMCFRDSLGQFIFVKSAHLTSFGSVLEAEAAALLQSIHTTISIGLHSVIFETDNKTLANAINSTSAHNSEFKDIVTQCRVLLSNNLDYVVSHIRRQANRVTHTIARASLSHTSPHIFYNVPHDMYSLIMNEMH